MEMEGGGGGDDDHREAAAAAAAAMELDGGGGGGSGNHGEAPHPPPPRMFELKASDGVETEADEATLSQSRMLKFRADFGDGEVVVPVREVTGRVLRQVLEYCARHARHDAAASACGDEAARERLRKEIEEWDARFIDVGLSAFYDLLMAAEDLEVGGLQDLCLNKFASMVKGKSLKQIRTLFSIEEDEFTPEQRVGILNEHPWAFDPEDEKELLKKEDDSVDIVDRSNANIS